MRFEWTDHLSTGIVAIDVQHKTLIKQVNMLLEACAEEKALDEIERFLRFLAGYVRIHFDEEERLMELHDYPNREDHIRQHRDFRRQIERLSDDCQNQAVTEKSVEEAVRLSTDWLITHIRTVDMHMAGFLRDKTGH